MRKRSNRSKGDLDKDEKEEDEEQEEEEEEEEQLEDDEEPGAFLPQVSCCLCSTTAVVVA